MPSDRLGDFVSNAEAMAAWQPVAHEALRETARGYRRTIAVADLAERVQAVAEVTTRQPPREWIGRLLERVAQQARAAGEPPLTSLCVEADGSVAPGYDRSSVVLAVLADRPGADLERVAAEHRFECYRSLAEDLPSDGGAVEPPRVVPRRATTRAATRASTRATTRATRTPSTTRAPKPAKPAARATAPEAVRAICPTCFQEFAANGTCGCS